MPASQSPPVLELRNLRKNFGRTEVIRGIDLALRPGERVAVIGPNGAGKSTLFNLISGLYPPTSGQVLLSGRNIEGKRAFEINRLGLSRGFQTSNLFSNLSVFENLRCAVLWGLGYRYTLLRFLSGLGDANQRAEEVMAELGLEHKRDVPAVDLDVAEQRALDIGITIAGGAKLVLLDEPTAGMGHAEASRFAGLITRLTAGKTLLMVEHDMTVVFGLADRIAVLVYGEVLAFDTPDAIRSNRAVQQAYLGAWTGGNSEGKRRP